MMSHGDYVVGPASHERRSATDIERWRKILAKWLLIRYDGVCSSPTDVLVAENWKSWNVNSVRDNADEADSNGMEEQ